MRRAHSMLAVLGLAAACNRDAPSPVVAAPAPPAASKPPAVTGPASARTTHAHDIVITNVGPSAIRIEGTTKLATAARLERRAAGGTWSLLDAAFTLDEGCSTTPPSCVDPSRALHPAPWSATCHAQCGLGCVGSSYEPANAVRVVVTTCDGTASIPSAPFELPGSDAIAAVERLWAADRMTSATAVRLGDPSAHWDGTAAADAARVAGFTVRSGSERLLDADARDALADAVRSPTGFDDSIAKRCAMHRLVGFRVTRSLASTGSEPKSQVVEIAIDLVCQKIFVVRGDVPPRTVHASHFDPSRPAFVALAQRVFPNDPEIR